MSFLNFKTTHNNKFIILYWYLLFQMVNLSFFLFYWEFLTVQRIYILINLVVVIIFHVKIQHKTIYLLFCFIFALIKLPRHDIHRDNCRLNDTIVFWLSCCVVWCHWSKNLSLLTLNRDRDKMAQSNNKLSLFFKTLKENE